MDTRDVVILGAGIAGTATAEHLLRFEPELRVLLADVEHVGAGSTSRSMAAFRHQWSVPAHVAFSRYSGSDYDRLSGLGYDVRFRRNGYLFLYTDPRKFDHAAARAGNQRRLGVEVEVLTREELAARGPARDPGSAAPDESAGRPIPPVEHLALDDLAGATWGPRDGFLDPLAVAQAYLDEARSRGLEYRPGLEATGIERDPGGGGLTGVRFGARTVATGRLVLAAGMWSPSVAERLGLSLPMVPAKRYIYHSRPLRGIDVGAWPLVIGDRGQHCRPSEGNTLMMGWEHRPRPLDACPDGSWIRDMQDVIEPGFGAGEYGLELLAELARHLPVLAEEVSLRHATCGWYAETLDGKGILGPDPRLPGLYHASGFSGHGIMHGGATGLILAEMILGHNSSLVSEVELERQFGVGLLLDGLRREPLEEMGL